MVTIREATPEEFAEVGQLMVRVYAALEGFPGPQDQPAYYDLLANVGTLTQAPGTEILVARDTHDQLMGAVVFIGDMAHYGSGGKAPLEQDACGFRLLAVDPAARGQGVGRSLSQACIARARELGRAKVVIHSTRAMHVAWDMYERLGFRRAEDLDFLQGDLQVYGFRYEVDRT